MSRWPKVALSDLILRVERFEDRDDFKTYTFGGTYSYARGIFVSGKKVGSSFALPRIQRIRKGDFVYCKIMAWEGAFGVVPTEADNCVLSNAFVVYETNQRVLDINFLGYYFKVSSHWNAIGSQSTGTNVRRQSLHPSQFEKHQIPLPPIDEQRTIVTRLDAVTDKVRQVEAKLDEIEIDLTKLLVSMAHRADLTEAKKVKYGWRFVQINDFLSLFSDQVLVDPAESYPNVGIYSYARGLFEKPPINGLATSAKSLFRIKSGLFIYSRLFAFEGAYGLVPESFDGHYVSNEFPTFLVDENQATPEFLFAYFKSHIIWSELAMGSKGLGDRRQRVHPEQILEKKIWLPPLDYQKKLSQIFAKVEEKKLANFEQKKAIQALLPSVLEGIFKNS